MRKFIAGGEMWIYGFNTIFTMIIDWENFAETKKDNVRQVKCETELNFFLTLTVSPRSAAISKRKHREKARVVKKNFLVPHHKI